MTLLTKYAPTSLGEFVFEDPLVKIGIGPFASGAMQDNLLLHGGYGDGKSTLAQIVANAGFHRAGKGNRATVIAAGKYNSTSHDLLDNGWTLGAIDGVPYPKTATHQKTHVGSLISFAFFEPPDQGDDQVSPVRQVRQ